MVAKLRQYGELSVNQTAAVVRIAEKRVEQMARKAAEAVEPAPTTPAPTGRMTVYGVIKGDKWVASDFGNTRKMLVKLDDGNKVWCSVPSKLFPFEPSDGIRGKRIKLTATFERSKDDEHFAFGSRPTAEPA